MAVAMVGVETWARPAGVDLTGKLFFFEQLDSSGNIIVNTTANGAVTGTIIEEATVGNAASIQLGGPAKVTAAATITPGQLVGSDATGKAVVYVSGQAAGVCLIGGVSGNIITVRLY